MTLLDDYIASAAAHLARFLGEQRIAYLHIVHLMAGLSTEDKSLNPEVIRTAMDRFGEALEPAIGAALHDAIRDHSAFLSSIRAFFLEPRERYSIEDLAAFWWVSSSFVAEICKDEPAGEDGGVFLSWPDAASLTVMFHIFRPVDVERALGDGFSLLRSDGWRTVPILLRLPKFLIDAALSEPAIRDEPIPARVERYLLELVAARTS